MGYLLFHLLACIYVIGYAFLNQSKRLTWYICYLIGCSASFRYNEPERLVTQIKSVIVFVFYYAICKVLK